MRRQARLGWLAVGVLALGAGAGLVYAQVADGGFDRRYMGFAEDFPHASGDHGYFMLGVRDDTGTTKTSAEGDYSPISVTQRGALRVTGDMIAGNNASVLTALHTVAMGTARADATELAAVTAGNTASFATNTQGQQLVRIDNPNRFSCTVVNSTATALTAFGGSCAAPGASKSLYITDIQASASAAATTTADQYLELKSGTGGSCGTGTAVVWAAFNGANAPVSQPFITPIKVAANNELCWMHAAAGNKTFVVNGFISP